MAFPSGQWGYWSFFVLPSFGVGVGVGVGAGQVIYIEWVLLE